MTIKVKHSEFGKGEVIPLSEKLNESGDIVSVDVLFEHGIEQNVDATILEKFSKKKKKKMKKWSKAGMVTDYDDDDDDDDGQNESVNQNFAKQLAEELANFKLSPDSELKEDEVKDTLNFVFENKTVGDTDRARSGFLDQLAYSADNPGGAVIKFKNGETMHVPRDHAVIALSHFRAPHNKHADKKMSLLKKLSHSPEHFYDAVVSGNGYDRPEGKTITLAKGMKWNREKGVHENYNPSSFSEPISTRDIALESSIRNVLNKSTLIRKDALEEQYRKYLKEGN